MKIKISIVLCMLLYKVVTLVNGLPLLDLLAWEDNDSEEEEKDYFTNSNVYELFNLTKYNDIVASYSSKISQTISDIPKLSSRANQYIKDTIQQQRSYNNEDNVEKDIVVIEEKSYNDQHEHHDSVVVDIDSNPDVIEVTGVTHIETPIEVNDIHITVETPIEVNDVATNADVTDKDTTTIAEVTNKDTTTIDMNTNTNIDTTDSNQTNEQEQVINNETKHDIEIINEGIEENIVQDKKIDDNDDDDNDDGDEDDALKEILELQRLEEEELMQEQELIKSDTDLINEAEKVAKEQEAIEAAERRANQTSSKTHKYTNSNDNSNSNSKMNSFTNKKTSLGGFRKSDKKDPNIQEKNSMFTTNTKSTPNRTDKSKFGGIESLLSQEMLDKANADDIERTEQNEEKYNRMIRNKVPRKYARPVEKVIKIYDNPKTTLYQVLSLSEDADYDDVKKSYRTMALILHPDKNIHPDAKKAFDAIQDAFEVLTSPIKRSNYDKKLSRRSGMTMKKVLKKLKTEWYNLKSRILLLIYKIRKGEGHEELEELVLSPSKHILNKVTHFSEKAIALSLFDRVSLLLELYEDNWKNIIVASFFISMVF